MIAKKYRLTENEFRKVLSRRKPFFSYGMVANIVPSKLEYARVGIVLSGKQAPGSVNRNIFRRWAYDLSRPFLDGLSVDVVFVLKKGKVLDHKNPEARGEMKQDIEFLWKTITKEIKKRP